MATTRVQIGLLTVTIDQERKRDRDFLDGLDDGMTCYCENDIQYRLMTVKELVDLMQTIARNTNSYGERFPRAWVSGFVLGWATALNNPDLANDDPCLRYIESLAHKHTPLDQNLALQTEEQDGEATQDTRDTEPLPLAVLQKA